MVIVARLIGFGVGQPGTAIHGSAWCRYRDMVFLICRRPIHRSSRSHCSVDILYRTKSARCRVGRLERQCGADGELVRTGCIVQLSQYPLIICRASGYLVTDEKCIPSENQDGNESENQKKLCSLSLNIPLFRVVESAKKFNQVTVSPFYNLSLLPNR